MNPFLAASITIKVAYKNVPPTQAVARDSSGQGVPHALWMLNEIEEQRNDFDAGKANRWLGYAQGVLVEHEIVTLEQVKTINVIS